MIIETRNPDAGNTGAADFVKALAGADDDGENIPEYQGVPESTRAARCSRSNWEESDGYSTVVAKLNTSWRIIACRDGIQWILQRLAGKRHGQPRWEGKRYCRTRKALMRSVHDLCGPVDATAVAILERLPEWIKGKAARAIKPREIAEKEHPAEFVPGKAVA